MEATNFFSGIAALGVTGDLQVTMAKASDTNWVVSVMLHNEQCGDEARKLIPAFTLNGTAQELDNGFFQHISAPMQQASGLMVNMEAYQKQLEVARKQSAMEKEHADKEKKEKEAKEKRYKETLQKAYELEQAGKYREAWMKVPEPAEFPEWAEDLRQRKSALASKFAPDLFAAPATVAAPQNIPAVTTAEQASVGNAPYEYEEVYRDDDDDDDENFDEENNNADH